MVDAAGECLLYDEIGTTIDLTVSRFHLLQPVHVLKPPVMIVTMSIQLNEKEIPHEEVQ